MKNEVEQAIEELEEQKQAILSGVWRRGVPTTPNEACAVMRTDEDGDRSELSVRAKRALSLAIGEGSAEEWNDFKASGPGEVVDRLERAQVILKELL